MAEEKNAAQTPGLTCDMQGLIETLPEFTDRLERYQNHLKAAQVTTQAQVVEDRRAELAREQARLDEQLAAGPFATVEEARAAVLDVVEVAKLIDDIETYREDYASVLANCHRPQTE